MKVHEFTLILTADPNQEEADRLYSIFDDGTIATVEGVSQIYFHREDFSLESAIGSALLDIRKAGFDAAQVHIKPKAVLDTVGTIDLRERGIDETQAAEMRARLASFAEDWENPKWMSMATMMRKSQVTNAVMCFNIPKLIKRFLS